MLHDPNKLLLIAGPCSLENIGICRSVAETLQQIRQTDPRLNIIFKGSFDKANRTSLESDRGTGFGDGLRILQTIREEFQFPTLTDVHLPEQCGPVAEAVDVLQIPAFLCRQTDILTAAAATGRTINVKKGQFLAPGDMQHVLHKLEEAGASEIWQTERGTTFGYQNLVVDMRSFPIMARHGHPTVMDATHSVQLPGGAGGSSGGQREFAPTLARAALAAGAGGVFLETHPEPDHAISDSASQIPVSELPALIEDLLKFWQAAR